MTTATDTVLYIVHKENWTDSRIADLLSAAGFAIDFRCHAAGDPLPEAPTDYRGVVLGGGAHSVYETERYPYMARELAFTRRVVEAGLPFLGICMGSQILAGAFGGETAGRPDGFSEFGFYPIEATEAGRDIFDGLTHVYQAHYESVVRLPEEAELLARGERFATQAFRIGEAAIGVQFHPDARLDDVPVWCRESPESLKRPGAQPEAEQRHLAPRHEDAIQDWSERLVDGLFGAAETPMLARA